MIWFTSDLHLNHQAIIDLSYRPFSSVEEMNKTLIDNWNDVVSDDDTVWVLGDFALGKTRQSIQMARGLKGYKHLVPGNHDTCWQGHKRWRREAQEYIAVGFEVHGHKVSIAEANEAFGHDTLACHFPYHGDHTEEERYGEYRPYDKGQILLHGHVHKAWSQRGRMLNVGVDVWGYAPVSLDTLVSIYNQGAGDDSHGTDDRLRGAVRPTGQGDGSQPDWGSVAPFDLFVQGRWSGEYMQDIGTDLS